MTPSGVTKGKPPSQALRGNHLSEASHSSFNFAFKCRLEASDKSPSNHPLELERGSPSLGGQEVPVGCTAQHWLHSSIYRDNHAFKPPPPHCRYFGAIPSCCPQLCCRHQSWSCDSYHTCTSWGTTVQLADLPSYGEWVAEPFCIMSVLLHFCTAALSAAWP